MLNRIAFILAVRKDLYINGEEILVLRVFQFIMVLFEDYNGQMEFYSQLDLEINAWKFQMGSKFWKKLNFLVMLYLLISTMGIIWQQQFVEKSSRLMRKPVIKKKLCKAIVRVRLGDWVLDQTEMFILLVTIIKL